MAYSDVVLADSPVGYWKLDETSGVTAVDSSVNSNDGVISGGPTMGANGLVFEPSGKCIDFDEVNDVVNAASIDVGSSDFSAEVWLKPLKLHSTVIYFVGCNKLGVHNGRWAIRLHLDNTVTAFLISNGGVEYSANSIVTCPVGKSSHIAMSICRSGLMRIYINGVSDASVDVSAISAENITNSLGFKIGATQDSGSGTARYLLGKLQHVAIYNTALTPLQIRQHYQAGIAQGFHKEVLALNPTAYYPLNESSGDAIDWSGNDNNGTLNGGVTQGVAGSLAYDDSTGYSFDGVDGSVGASINFTGNDPFSISFFCNINSTQVDAGGNIGLVDIGTYTSTTGFGVWFDKGAGNQLHLRLNQNYQNCDITIVTDAVNHVVVTYDGTTLKGYVNTVLENTLVASYSTSTLGLIVGTRADTSTEFFTGDLSEVAIFTTALTPTQIRTLYQSGKTLIEDRGYPKVIKNLNPSLYMRLGEASGTTAFDESGNGNDGVINGSPAMATVDGALHQSRLKAMTFDGVDDYIESDYQGVSGGGLRTTTAWVRVASLTDNGNILAYGPYTNTNHYSFRVQNNGYLKHTAHGTQSITNNVVMVVNQWLFVVCVNTTNNQSGVIFYVDGQLVPKTAGSQVFNTLTTVNSRIGASPAGAPDFYLKADISELSHLPTALTAQQIKQIYEAGKSRYAAEVISYEPTGYWRGNEASGTNLIDYGSEGNDGTLINAAFGAAASPLDNETSTSIDFDGSGDYVTIPHTAAYNQDEQTWLFNSFAPAVEPSNSKGLLFKAATTGLAREVNSAYSSAGEGLELGLGTSAGISYASNSDVSVFGTGWNFSGLTKVLNGADDDITGYFNGEVAGASTTVGHGNQNSNPIEFGRVSSASTAGRYYDGQIAEVSVFPVALTPPQILDIYEMASFLAIANTFTLFGIKGTLSESLVSDKWIARTHKRDDGGFLDSYSWDGIGFYNVLTNQYQGAVDVTILQDIGLEWSDTIPKVIGDRVYPTNAITNSFYFECTTGGTTSGSEPNWPSSGTIVDGTVTWTWKGGLVRPKIHGPLKPTLIA